MKKQSLIGVVVLGALLVVFVGISQAGGWMHRSGGDKGPVSEAWETGATPDMASGEGTAYELRGTEHPFPVGFVAAGPIETGSAPEPASGGGTAYELRGTEHPFPVGFVLAEPIETGTLSATPNKEAWMKDYGND